MASTARAAPDPGGDSSFWRRLGGHADRVITILSLVGAVISSLAAVGMVVLITVEVIGRAFFRFSTLLADEYSGYLLVAMAFLGLAYTTRGGGHIRADSVVRLLPPQARAWVITLGLVLALAFGLLLTIQTFGLVRGAFELQERAITVRRTLLFIPQLLMPAGLAIFCLVILRDIIRRLAGLDDEPIPEEFSTPPEIE